MKKYNELLKEKEHNQDEIDEPELVEKFLFSLGIHTKMKSMLNKIEKNKNKDLDHLNETIFIVAKMIYFGIGSLLAERNKK